MHIIYVLIPGNSHRSKCAELTLTSFKSAFKMLEFNASYNNFILSCLYLSFSRVMELRAGPKGDTAIVIYILWDPNAYMC